jgi:hypothetical protein
MLRNWQTQKTEIEISEPSNSKKGTGILSSIYNTCIAWIRGSIVHGDDRLTAVSAKVLEEYACNDIVRRMVLSQNNAAVLNYTRTSIYIHYPHTAALEDLEILEIQGFVQLLVL